MVPVQEKRQGGYKDWNYKLPGTRTRDIQNMYPVPGKMDYEDDVLQFKDVTHTGSNTWKHKHDWYKQDLSKLWKKKK